ncbi:MAG TPA: hypothetical protein VMV69_08615 [Pirellulales bacterium]|nr:hypothetical protein [Pirellulales bacterium]
MTYQGVVQGRVVVLPDGVELPDGTEVTIVPRQTVDSGPRFDASLPIGKKLAELARWAETQPCDLPADLAINHDHYLHGLPKRE